MSKIRIAVVSGLFAALLAGVTAHEASAARPVHTEAAPVQCCYAADLGTH